MTDADFYSDAEITEIRKKLDMGYLVPVSVRGRGMRPMLKEESDKAIIFKLFSTPERGSVVLCKNDEKYFLSRVYKSGKDTCTVMRDREFVPYTVKTDGCIAEVKAIERNGKKRQGGLVWWYFGSARLLLREITLEIIKLIHFKKR